MHAPLLKILAQIAVYATLASIPVLWTFFTDRFRRLPNPSEYAALFTVAAFLGILLFVPSVSIIFVAALLALGMARISADYALHGVTYERRLRPARLFPGDVADLEIRLTNRKMLPLAWSVITDPVHFNVIRATQNLDTMLRFSGGLEVTDALGSALVNRAAVGPYQTLLRTYTVSGIQRGAYALGPATVETGDPFGIFRRKAERGPRMEVLVYPRIFRPDELGLPFRQALGELVTRRSLFEDPTLIAGSREYRPDDPLRRVHWKATARTGTLQVRVNDASTTAQLMIVLNLNTFQHVWQGVDLDRMEAGIDVAASIAMWALEKGFVVGLRSNGVVSGAEETPRVAPSANPRQETYLLEQLARLSFSGRFAPEAIMLDEAERLVEGATLLFVTSVITPPLIRILSARRLAGRVSVVYCGRFAAPVVPGVPIHLIVPPPSARRAAS